MYGLLDLALRDHRMSLFKVKPCGNITTDRWCATQGGDGLSLDYNMAVGSGEIAAPDARIPQLATGEVVIVRDAIDRTVPVSMVAFVSA